MSFLKKYSSIIYIVLIILPFMALALFQDRLQSYVSQAMQEIQSKEEKSLIKKRINTLYNYIDNGSAYDITFLEFGAISCKSCKQMQLVLDEIKTQYSNVNVQFINVLLKENAELVKYYGVMEIPRQVLLNKCGLVYYEHIGYISADEIAKNF